VCTINAEIGRLDKRTERLHQHRRIGMHQEVAVKSSTLMTVVYLCDRVSTLPRHDPSVLCRYSLRPVRRQEIVKVLQCNGAQGNRCFFSC